MQESPRGRPLPEEVARLAPGESLDRNCAVLLTDVVDSTQTAARIGDAAIARLWAAHDKAFRELLRKWDGIEIDRSDGMLLLFTSATEAVGWAADYHDAIAALDPPIKARAGLHVGPVSVRRNPEGDVAFGAKQFEADGLAKPLAARIMALAAGAQTLLSQQARDALGENAPPVRSTGHWRLKGAPEPIELFEACGEDAAWRPPPDGEKAHRVLLRDGIWVPAREVPHTLPGERNRFVGRERPMRELWQHFESGARLVTVAGVGGTGKTRLAVGFGTRSRGSFPGGVWFCDLSQARDLSSLAGAVAAGMDVTLDKGDAVSLLAGVIRGRGNCLIVLDNFEQVAAESTRTIGAWLDASESARFLVTSREVLGIAGEVVHLVQPLGDDEAIDLFRSRAAESAPGVAFTPEDEAALPKLVRMLDGLPLAIELAASRVRLMPPRTLLARMGERFKLLALPGRGGRQSTLRAAFDWSWDLLSAAERSVLAQLSVFEGGFCVPDAEAVIDLAGLDDPPWVPDAVHSLLDKSLVQHLPRGRFGLLGTVRDYAAEQLRLEGRFPGSGPAAATSAMRRHVAYFATAGHAVATADGCANLDNAVAACRHAVTMGLHEFVAGALDCAWAALEMRGPPMAGLELARAVAAMPEVRADARRIAEDVFGATQLALGNSDEAQVHFRRALESAQAGQDASLQARAHLGLGDSAVAQVRTDDALRHYADAARLARAINNLALECEAAKGMGNVHYMTAQPGEARRHYLEALDMANRAQMEVVQCAVRSNLGNLAMGQGELAAAQLDFEAALELARRSGRTLVEGNTLINLGWLAHLRGETGRSTAFSEAALEVARHIANPRMECVALCNLAIADESVGNLGRAQTRFEAALAQVRVLGEVRWEGQFLTYLGLLHIRQAQHGEARQCLARGEQLLRGASDRMSLGVILCAQAQLHAACGDRDAAAGALQEAQALAAEVGALPDSELGLAIKRAQGLLDA